MNVGELTATFDVDVDESGIVQAEAAMEGLQRSADGRLRDMHGRFVSESRLMGEALRDGIRVGTEAIEEAAGEAGDELARGLGEGGEDASRRLLGSLSDAELAVNGFTRSADGRIRDLRGRFVSESTTIGEALERGLGEAGENGARRLEDGVGRARRELGNGGDDGNRFSRVLSSIGDAAGPIGSVAGRIAMVGGAIGGALPLVAGLSAALVAVAPAAGVAATGLFAVASAGAAIKIGTSGIGSAIKAAFADAPASAGAAAGAANQYANAQRAVKNATEQAAYANEQAVRHVADAERNLTDAQRAALQVQQALDDARHQAAQDLEDLNNRVADAGLAQRDAVLNVQSAQDALTAATAEGSTATERQRAQAQLALDQAKQRLLEQGITYQRLQQQAEQANAAGVDGSARVVQAQDRIVQAQRQVEDQTRALQDAQVQQARTAAQGAEQVQRAIEALHQAGAGAAAGGVDPLAAALAKLSPNARAFVEQLIALKPALSDLRFDVQQTLFEGFAGSLRTGAGSILPVLRTALVGSAETLNSMGRAAVSTAGEMAENGTLGRAFASANKGLAGLTRLPSVFIQGVSQIGAAAGPAFERLGAAAGGGLDRLSKKLTDAFNSGGMQKAIDTAIDLLGQLGTAFGNVGRFIGEVLGAAQQSGGGFINTLVVISGALASAFAEPAIKDGLRALFLVTSAVAREAAPLLISALRVVGPVLSALGPPVELLVHALGSAGLQPIIDALGPVLLAAAQAVGQLVLAATPLLGLVGTLVSMALPALTPLLAGAELVFRQLSPVVAAVATALQGFLGPVLAQLPVLIEPFVTVLTTLTGIILPVLTDLISQLPLAQLGQSFGEIAVALAPLLAQLAVLVGDYLKIIFPLITPIITAVVQLAGVLAGVLSGAVTNVVVPALRMITQLLHGDFSGALSSAKDVLVGLAQTVEDIFRELPQKIGKILADLASSMFDAGKKLISSLIDGLKSMAGSLKDAAGDLVGKIADFFPHSPARTGPFSGRGYPLYSGQAIGLALAEGLASSQDRVRAATASLMGTANGGLGLGQLAVAGGAFGASGAGASGFHIENYYESQQGDARRTAAELAFLGRGRG